MSSPDVTAVLPRERRRIGLAEILSAAACLLAAGAFVIAMTHAGPAGAKGARGATGPQGPQGEAGSTANVQAIQKCIPELTAWISAFNVHSDSNSNGNAFWLTNAYLDTSAQQVSVGCKKVLGIK